LRLALDTDPVKSRLFRLRKGKFRNSIKWQCFFVDI